jgi:hypothetical protein
MNTKPDKIMFALTMVNKDGMRTLARANQGRNHFETKELAEEYLKDVWTNNSEDTLKSVFGDVIKMRVDPVECYHHGDAKRVYFND